MKFMSVPCFGCFGCLGDKSKRILDQTAQLVISTSLATIFGSLGGSETN